MGHPATHERRAVCFGECMLELQGPAFGTLRQGYGGDTLNTAVYLARCGAAHGLQVAYATALGDDKLSHGLLQRWQEQGLSVDLVRLLPGRLPGLYFIDVDAQGERHFSYWRDQAAARAYFDAPAGSTPLEQQADGLGLLYFSGISLAILPPAGRSRLLAVAAQVRRKGGMVAFDNNYRSRLWADAATAQDAHRQALAVCSVALLTLDDEQQLWGQPDAACQRDATLAIGVPELVIKQGAAPTLARGPDGVLVEIPAVPGVQVADTTAAGDSFAGAYLAARLRGCDVARAAAHGNRLAARVIQHLGAVVPLGAMADLLGP
jgi:2-dehydro-3-deoxygluconokinase